MIQYLLQAIHCGVHKTIGYNIPYTSILAILLSFCLWTVTYTLTRRFFKDQSTEFCIRVVTFIHGLTATITSANICFFSEGKCLIGAADSPSTDYQHLLMVTNLGYFILDVIWSIYNQSETNLMLMHHTYAILALYYVLQRSVGGGQFACGMAAMECTNPLLQSRWFLRSLGYHKTTLFDTVELIFMALFVFIRLGLGSMAMFIAFTDQRIDWLFAINLSIIYGLSWMFAYNMCMYVAGKYNKTIAPQQTESNYEVAL